MTFDWFVSTKRRRYGQQGHIRRQILLKKKRIEVDVFLKFVITTIILRCCLPLKAVQTKVYQLICCIYSVMKQHTVLRSFTR